eukprot:823426-Prymnesium_polylepis.1
MLWWNARRQEMRVQLGDSAHGCVGAQMRMRMVHETEPWHVKATMICRAVPRRHKTRTVGARGGVGVGEAQASGIRALWMKVRVTGGVLSGGREAARAGAGGRAWRRGAGERGPPAKKQPGRTRREACRSAPAATGGCRSSRGLGRSQQQQREGRLLRRGCGTPGAADGDDVADRVHDREHVVLASCNHAPASEGEGARSRGAGPIGRRAQAQTGGHTPRAAPLIGARRTIPHDVRPEADHDADREAAEAAVHALLRHEARRRAHVACHRDASLCSAPSGRPTWFVRPRAARLKGQAGAAALARGKRGRRASGRQPSLAAACARAVPRRVGSAPSPIDD